MNSNPKLIQDARDVAEVAQRLAAAKAIGVDTEFIRETTFYPKVALIQVATTEEAWLLDPTTLSGEDLAPILEVLKDPGVLKVMHAAYADQECFYHAYGVVAEPVLDTAVAGALCGYGDNVGLAKLLKEILRIHLPKGRARVKWLQRPLSRELLQYAEQDVLHLVELGEQLRQQLDSKSRVDWAMRESRIEACAFEVTPDEIARKIAKNGQLDEGQFLVLRELIHWREERAKNANLPRGWVADNEILVALAKVRPSTIEDLRSFRGLNAKELERQGTRILEAIERGKAIPKQNLSLPQRPPIPTEHEDHALDLVKAYVAYLAARHQIAPRFLIPSTKTLSLIQNSDRTKEEWVDLGILTEAASGLVGEELKALLTGKRGLVLRGGKVEILALD